MADGSSKTWARMEDVARLAGVTKMTVSRALRDPAMVAAPTRERIEQAMHETGFVPNRNAGSLALGKTRIIAALIPTIHHAVFAATVQGMADGMRAHGYHLLLGDTRHSLDEESGLIDAFLSRRPEGLILTGVRRAPDARRRLGRARVPIVETWEMSASPLDMLVGFSNRKAGYMMTRHLLECGYRRIAFINGQRRNNERVQRREAGYIEALREAGLPQHIETLTGNSVHMADGSAALARILEQEPRTDAVFCTNDVFAIGALLECRGRGLTVPDQFGVAGFHDLEIGSAVQPSLTTVRVPAYRIGKEAAGLVLGRLSGEIVGAKKIELPFEIVARGSTRSPSR